MVGARRSDGGDWLVREKGERNDTKGKRDGIDS